MTTKIQDDNISLWVEALRSDTYSQTIGTLCDNDGYCCLGVGGKIMGMTDNDLNGVGLEEGAETAYRRIREFYGLEDSLGYYGDLNAPDNNYKSLSRHNDTDGLTFSEIADIIESRPEGLFT